MMDQPLHFILFGTLMAMVLVWFGLCIWTFRRLENVHAQKYLEMGRPSFFLRNNIENNWLFLKFLCRSQYVGLNDHQLTRICKFMKIYLAVYCVIFLSTIIFFLSTVPRMKP